MPCTRHVTIAPSLLLWLHRKSEPVLHSGNYKQQIGLKHPACHQYLSCIGRAWTAFNSR